MSNFNNRHNLSRIDLFWVIMEFVILIPIPIVLVQYHIKTIKDSTTLVSALITTVLLYAIVYSINQRKSTVHLLPLWYFAMLVITTGLEIYFPSHANAFLFGFILLSFILSITLSLTIIFQKKEVEGKKVYADELNKIQNSYLQLITNLISCILLFRHMIC